jgi:hypothetical protein
LEGIVIDCESPENDVVTADERVAKIGNREAPLFIVVRVGSSAALRPAIQGGVDHVTLVGLPTPISPLPHENPEGHTDLWRC